MSKIKFRSLDLWLLVIIIVGSFFATRAGWERYRLSKAFDRLSGKIGDLSPSDQSKVYVQAIATQEPLEFAWRIYIPANYPMNIQTGRHGGGSISPTPRDFIARVRFREEDGNLHVYVRYSGSHGGWVLGDEIFASVLHNAWDRIQVQQLGTDHVAIIEPGQTIDLLRLIAPEDIYQDAAKGLASLDRQAFFPDLFKMRLGPDPRFAGPPRTTVPPPPQGAKARAGKSL